MQAGTRTGAGAITALVVLLATATAALADAPKVRTNAADQELAKRAVVQLSDFRAGSGWSGGPKKPDDSSGSQCNFDPKQSDLVETGYAESSFKYKVPVLLISSGATVYENAEMAQRSWKRAKPGLFPFVRCLSQKGLAGGMKVVSVKPLGFPELGSGGAAYRTVFDIAGGSTSVRMVIDLEFFTRGRSLLFLMQFAPYADAAEARAAEARLVGAMSARLAGPVA